MADGRKEVLGEVWFPVGEISVESLRERAALTALPPTYYLHVWFARRPLTTSRAAILGAILDSNFKKDKFLEICGVPLNVNIVKAYKEYLRAKSEKRKINNPFTWKRAFTHTPSNEQIEEIALNISQKNILLLDPFAGGGSIPFESTRLGINIAASDLNPVAFICLKGTVEYPPKFKNKIIPDVIKFCQTIHSSAKAELDQFFPHIDNEEVFSYLWARTLECPHCGLVIPLSPNWWIADKDNSKVAAKINLPNQGNICSFDIVNDPEKKGYDPENGTVSGGDAVCPRCHSTIDSQKIKHEATLGKIGHQLFCVCLKKKISGKKKGELIFREPNSIDLEAVSRVEYLVKQEKEKWINNGEIPSEYFPTDANDDRPIQYGMNFWYDFYNPRQLLTHSTYLRKYLLEKEKLLNDCTPNSKEWDYNVSILLYCAIVFDCCVNYNSVQSRWDNTRRAVRGSLDMQAFPFRWSYGEWNQLIEGGGYLWTVQKTLKSLKELINFLPNNPGKVDINNNNACDLPYSDNSITAIITDPPYSNNVMYAEMSDFFYVWLKLLLKDIYPNEFSSELTNKADEAVSNIARFSGNKKAKVLAEQDYSAKMEASFREMYRVLNDDGVLCVMFTHREAEAWESLAESLMNAGFVLRSSWPVHTEPGDKYGKTNKGALKVTVLLYCRKRKTRHPGRWEDVVDEIRSTANIKVKEYQEFGIFGPDLLVSLYGPALGKFSEYYPVKDITGKAIRAGEALSIVAQVVNEYLTGDIRGADMEALAYLNLLRNAPGLTIEYDLARITTVFGGNTSVDALDVKGGSGLVKKSGSKIKILTSKNRQELGVLNPDRTEKFKGLMDIVHAAILIYERQGIESVTRLLQETGRDTHDAGIISVLSAIGAIGEDASSDLVAEARMANALLEALGHSPAGVGKSGERITHYM